MWLMLCGLRIPPPPLGWDEESQGVEGEAPFFTSLPHLSWPVALGLSAGA